MYDHDHVASSVQEAGGWIYEALFHLALIDKDKNSGAHGFGNGPHLDGNHFEVDVCWVFRRGPWECHFERTSDNGDYGFEVTISREEAPIISFRFDTNWREEEVAPEWSFEQGTGPYVEEFIRDMWPELGALEGDLFRGRPASDKVDPTSTYVIGIIQEILRRLAELPDTTSAS